MFAAVAISTILYIGFPLQNKRIPQPFFIVPDTFMQADLKIKQRSANILLNCLILAMSVLF